MPRGICIEMLDYPGVWQASYLDNFLETSLQHIITKRRYQLIGIVSRRRIVCYQTSFSNGTWLQTESYFITISEYKRDPLIESTNISVHNNYSRLSLHFVILDRHHYLFNVFTLCLPKWYKLIIYTNIANGHGVR